MARVAPPFDAASFTADGMRDGDLINLDVGAIMAHRPEVSAALGEAMAALRSTGTISP